MTSASAHPRVNVIIAMRNAEATIGRTLRSLVEQTESRWHAIVVDDSSTDGSAAIVSGLAEPRVTLLHQKQAGPGAARNRALDAATGDYIAFLDADDWLEPRALEVLLASAESGGTGASRGRCSMCSPDGRPIGWVDPPSPPGLTGLDEMLAGEGFAIHSQVVRRDLVSDVRFPVNMYCFEDSAFFISLARRGVKWVRTNHLVCSYRLRPRNRGTQHFADSFQVVQDVIGGSHSNTTQRPRLHIRALNHATMTLIQDSSPHKDLGASVISRIGGARFGPMDLALSAHNYLPLSQESGLGVWQHRLEMYAGHLRAWWDRCIREGWTSRSETREAIPLLAHLIANSLDIPTRLIDRLLPGRPVVLLGLGANGLRLAAALADRSIPFQVRDDALTPEELAARLPDCSTTLIRGPIESSAQCLMSVLDDRAFLSSLPKGLDIVRWSDAVDELSRSVLNRLRATMIPTPMNPHKRPVDLFLGSYKRPDKLAAMIESVRETGYPARVLIAAGDPGTIEVCSRYPGLVECVFNTEVNRRIGCTAPLNHVYRSLVRHDALFCTDDCIFATDALDIAMETLYTHFPDGDGVVGLKQENIPDGYDLAFPLMGRKFLDRFAPEASGKDIFFPGYFHLFNDAEIGITIKCLGNWVFEPRATIRHFHPAHGGALDATHGHGLTHHVYDQKIWCERRARGAIWGIDAEPASPPAVPLGAW